MSQNINAIEQALHYQELGYTCLPLKPGLKQAAIRWKDLQGDKRLSDDRLRDFFAEANNIGILTGPVIVVDCDDPELAEVVLSECGNTPTITQTPSGGLHFWYRARKGVDVGNRVRIKERALDLRAKGGYVVVPPSRINGIPYSWVGSLVPVKELPCFKVTWTRERKHPPKKITHNPGETDDVMVARARCYIANIEGAISGQRGHDKTFRVACVLVQKFALTFDQAWPLFLEWNEQCEPPWTEDELRHKLQGAIRITHKS